MRRLLSLAFVILCTTSGLASAQTDAQVLAGDAQIPARMTLDDALRLAAARNPAVAAARSGIQIAEAGRLDARFRPNPAVTLNGEGWAIGASPRPPFLNGQELTLRIDQEIETAGRKGLRVQAASQGVEAAQAAFRNQWRQTELEVKRAYFQIVLAEANLRVARASLDEIDRVIALTKARFEQGETSGSEVRRLQVERLKFLDDVLAADLATRNAKSALLAILNAGNLATPFDVAGTLTDKSPATPAVPTLDVTALRTQALASRADLNASRLEARRADTETRLQRALRTPNITVGGGYKRDFGTNAIVFGVTVPLPISNRNAGGIARATAAAQQADQQVAAVRASVLLDVQQAANAVEVNRQRVDYIEREYLKTAQQSRDTVLASYRLGASDLINFLDAQRAYRDTQRTYNQALYDLRISQYQLAAAVGTTTVQAAAQP